jgi:hypothetical protein
VSERRRVAVEVRQEIAPDGRVGILLQLPNGYLLVSPADAVVVASALTAAAVEVRGLFGDWD